MMNFKQFLLEQRQKQQIDFETAQELIKTRFSQAFNLDFTILRGSENLENQCAIIERPDTERTPLGGGSTYTKILNMNSRNSKYPSRYKATICSISSNIAKRYGQVYAILPENNTEIAICPTHDIWTVPVNYFDGRGLDMADTGKEIEELLGKDETFTLNNLNKKLAKALKLLDSDDQTKLNDPNISFSYDKLGFKLRNINNLKLSDFAVGNSNNELWFEGASLAIPLSLYKELK